MSITILPNDDKARLGRIGLTGPDTPIPLKDACERHFSGTISVATLKAEHKRGNLEISKIGRQYFTTLNQIRKMIKKCRVVVSPPVSRQWMGDPDELERRKAVRVALQLRLERQKNELRRKPR
jgi:hypothetical protein